MEIAELIAQLHKFAELLGDDAEVILYDRIDDRELRVNPDADVFDFEVLRGDREVVIEFN